MGLSRNSHRHPPEADAATRELAGRIVEIAHARRRFGYRRLHVLLMREGVTVNHKKLRRLYGEERLQVRRRGGPAREPWAHVRR